MVRNWANGKMLLIFLYLALDYQAVSARIASLWPTPSLAVYLALYIALAIALISAAFTASRFVRIVWAFLLAVGSVALHSYEWTTGSPLDYKSFEIMIASMGDAGDAAAQHAGTLAKACGASLILLAGIILPISPQRRPFRFGWALPLAGVVGLASLLYVRGGEGTRGLPAPFSPIAQSAIMALLHLTETQRERQTVLLRPQTRDAAGDIVLVIDESIAANYLDINHPEGVYSGLAVKRPEVRVFNFGVAAAVTNCSAGSNRTLRFGGTRETYRRAAKVMPSIWAFARRAGLRTVYLDGQRRNGTLHNLMTAEERAEIEEFVQLGETPVRQRDHLLAKSLADRLNNGVPEFILVNKVGAHFPVADKFPDDAAVFRPLPKRGDTNAIIDMGPVHGDHLGTSDEWRLYRNAYRNAVIWNTGGFFDRLLPRFKGSGAVLIYTSDHGQDLHEGGHGGKATHCVNDPRPEEAAVPIVVIEAGGSTIDWRSAAESGRHTTSHFRIFPTLLQLMGYPPGLTESFYGPTLVAPTRDPMTFTIDYFAALGREPEWRRVDPAELEAPPRSDHSALAERH